MKAFVSKLAIIWRLALPYFRSEDRKAGLILLITVVSIELSLVAINVMINQWRNRFFQALQDYNWNSFITELLIFFVLAGVFVLLAVYQLYLNQWLQIRWRRWMTERYLDVWLTGANHYRMQLLGDEADNPDQRISDDIRLFISNGLTLALGVLNSVVSFFSFVVILWALSAQAPFTLFGINFAIPGYLVWAALIYSAIGTVIVHLIGRALVGLNFRQQRYEADFRYNLVRTRENGEQIALLEGERAERQSLLERFGRLMGNWMLLMKRTKKLSYFSYSYSQASVVFPYAVAGPAYFAKTLQLGGLMQTASAFNSVQEALSFFIDAGNYRQLAEWLAVVDRLDGFERAVNAGRAAAVTPPHVAVQPSPDGRAIELANLEVTLPGGRPLVGAERVVLHKGEAVLFNGPSGAGKSTLFRAITGIWPFGSGTVTMPKDAHVMTLPQRPYFPVGTLAAAIAYPAEPTAFSREQLTETLEAVGLPALAPRLDEEAHWNRMLSLGEQQRLGIARAILEKPDYLLLDEATASLDEPAEAKLYRLLQARLPNAAIISIGHRSTLDAFHKKRFVLEPDAKHYRVREAAIAPAAE